MTVNIFQLPIENDRIFRGFDEKHYPKLSDYKKVFTIETSHVMADDIPDYLEAIFEKFNIDRPKGFKGHSLSVSDIVVLEFFDTADTARIFFCDIVGWKELDPEKMGYIKLAG